MDTSLALSTALISAVAVGLGCGVGCGSIATPFIITKLLGDQKDTKQSFFAYINFALGKIMTLIILGIVTSLIGSEIISILSHKLPFDLSIFFRIACIVFGLSIIYKTIKKSGKCHSKCKGCNEDIKKASFWYTPSYFLSGALYALTPCPPLTFVLVYAATINPMAAALILAIFGLANSITPLLIYAPITGFIVIKMKQEICKFTTPIQVLAGIMLVVLGGGW